MGAPHTPDAWDDFLAPPAPPLPPPPAPVTPTARVIEPPAPAPEGVLALGPPPADAMGAAKWAYQVYMQMAHDVINDKTLAPARRRKELTATLSAAAKWMTDATRYDIAQIIERDRRELEAKKRGRAAAAVEKRTGAPPAAAKVIPIRRSDG